MKIELELDCLADMRGTWRKSVDRQIPMTDDFKTRKTCVLP